MSTSINGREQPFRILDLPAEIRIAIYKFVLGGRTIRGAEQANNEGLGTNSLTRRPLLEVCRLIRAEAYPYRYFETKLSFHPGHKALSIPIACKQEVTEINVYIYGSGVETGPWPIFKEFAKLKELELDVGRWYGAQDLETDAHDEKQVLSIAEVVLINLRRYGRRNLYPNTKQILSDARLVLDLKIGNSAIGYKYFEVDWSNKEVIEVEV